eukprot:1187341-Prorocentrum_minimum.AAC.2
MPLAFFAFGCRNVDRDRGVDCSPSLMSVETIFRLTPAKRVWLVSFRLQVPVVEALNRMWKLQSELANKSTHIGSAVEEVKFRRPPPPFAPLGRIIAF